MEPSADTGTGGLRRRTRIACKPCRQNKNRCGMRSPPCARCVRLNIHCTIEPFYRRVNQQDRVQQLEAHVQELRDLLKRQEEQPASAQVISPGSTRSPGTKNTFPSYMSTDDAVAEPSSGIGARPRRGLESEAEAAIDQEGMSEHEERPESSQADYEIGPVKLSVERADRLVAIFFQKYHPMLPILEESRSAAEYYKVSRLLFWSIMAVASRHYATDTNLLMKLTPTLSELLCKSAVSNSASLAQVQALILNSCWPLPNFRFWTDKCRVYTNIALNNAMDLGLHMPGHEEEYSRETVPPTVQHTLERSRTWIACKILSHSLSMDSGLPPILSLRNNTIFKSHNTDASSEIPLELQQNLVIQEYSNRGTQILFNETLEQPLTTKLNIIEQSFESLQQGLNFNYDSLSFMNSLRLSGALLDFQCIYFLVDEAQESEAKRQGLLRAYETASSMITKTISYDYAHEELKYAPAAAARLIFMAALVIFRVLHSSYTSATSSTGQKLNYSAGQVLYNSVGFVVNQCSVTRDKKDLPARMPDMLKELWRIGENDAMLRSQEPTLQMKTRLGASLAFDCLRLWRENRNRQIPRLWEGESNSQSDQQKQQKELQRPQQQQQQINPPVPYITSPVNTLQPEATMQTATLNELNMPVLDWFNTLGSTTSGGVMDSEWELPPTLDQNLTEDWGVYGFI